MRNHSRRGVALIICLAVIVLLTVLILALFSQARFHRKIEASGAARAKAEILAHSGLDYVVSRFIREITDPANSDEINGAFKPRTLARMRPSVQLKRAARNLRMVHVPALLKQSIADFDPLASVINSSEPDGAGNFVGPKRWNAPMFHYSTPQFTAAAQVPDWIYLSTAGATKSAPVVGRIAFNVYEIDGLLDLSIAGYPSTVTNPAEIDSLKASVAGANVKMITSFGRYLDQTLTDIRSAGSSGRGEFVENAWKNTNGFLEPAPGDTHFASRLDLIRYGLTNKFDNNALAFVTAWSRSLDAPSWDPPVPTAANQFAPAVKRTSEVTVTDFLLDGTTREQKWKAGDPVAARRFPLDRLRWFDKSGGQRSKAIAQYFSVVPGDDGSWRYTEDHIRTLGELRNAAREPNFFEMLKAAIESGSLGQDPDKAILRIGIAIIDARNRGDSPPYHTVGELGRVARDGTDRTLDFSAMETGHSPDAALLDYFSVHEAGPDGIVAGRVGLNTNLGDVLATQISGTLFVRGGSATIDSLGKSALYRMADQVGGDILQSPADLVGRFSPSADGSKEKSEAPVRALGTAGQTRTWNFFVDLIAQTGKLPPGSDDLADFFSEGECRLWMHVAIDRFTGEVIDSQIEAYQE